MASTNERPSFWSRVRNFVRAITVEPMYVMNELAMALEGNCFQLLSLQKICLNSLHQPEIVCANLTAYDDIKKEVQDIETNYEMYRSFIAHIPMIVVSLCLGAWSDRHDRKVPMLISKCGVVLQSFFLLLNAVFMKWPVEMLFMHSAIAGVTGGGFVFYALALSYVADRTTPKNRIWRFGLLDVSRFIAFPIGTVISGYTHKYWGFIPIFAASSGIRLLSILYLVVRIQGLTMNPSNTVPLPGNKWRDLFNWTHFVDCWKTCIKSRGGTKRSWILLILLANWTMSVPGFSEGGPFFLYFRYFRNWSFVMYSNYLALGTALAVIGLLILVPLLTHVAKLSSPVMELIGNFARIANPVIVCFSTKNWMLWAASSLTPFYPFCYPAMSSMLTLLVDKDEIGKVLSIKGSSEVMIPLFSDALYTQLYQHTKSTFPGGFLLLSASFHSVSFIIFIYILIGSIRHKGYEEVPPTSSVNNEEEA